MSLLKPQQRYFQQHQGANRGQRNTSSEAAHNRNVEQQRQQQGANRGQRNLEDEQKHADSVKQKEFTPEERQAISEATSELGKAIAIGCVPLVGQAIDAYDTIESLWNLYSSKDSSQEVFYDAQFDLIVTLIGWIPAAGDGVKKPLKMVNRNEKRFAPVLFPVMNYAITQINPYLADMGLPTIPPNPEQLLLDLFSETTIGKILKEAKESILNSWAYQKLPAAQQRQLKMILEWVEREIPVWVKNVFERKIKKWIGMQRNNSAHVKSITDKSAKKPQPESQNKAGDNGKEGGNRGAGIGSRSDVLALDRLSNKALGILGEHMADYWARDQFGGGGEHDNGRNTNKLNDKHKLVRLGMGKSRGRGIDAVWNAGGRFGKPYAIIEAKASHEPMKSLGALLRDLSDKSESGAGATPTTTKKKKPNAGAGGQSTGQAVDTSKSRTPMSMAWIDDGSVKSRLVKATNLLKADEIRKAKYSRHVVFFGALQVVEHIDAVARGKPDNAHETHQETKVWNDSDIDVLVQERLKKN